MSQFVEDLKNASKIVRTWPKWKQELLGGTSNFWEERQLKRPYMLNSCSDHHEKICHEGPTCPICDIIFDLKTEIDDLKQEINELKKELKLK